MTWTHSLLTSRRLRSCIKVMALLAGDVWQLLALDVCISSTLDIFVVASALSLTLRCSSGALAPRTGCRSLPCITDVDTRLSTSSTQGAAPLEMVAVVLALLVGVGELTTNCGYSRQTVTESAKLDCESIGGFKRFIGGYNFSEILCQWNVLM